MNKKHKHKGEKKRKGKRNERYGLWLDGRQMMDHSDGQRKETKNEISQEAKLRKHTKSIENFFFFFSPVTLYCIAIMKQSSNIVEEKEPRPPAP